MKLFFLSVTLLFFSSLYAQQIKINEDEVKVFFTFKDQDVDGELSNFEFIGTIDLSNIEAAVISGSVATETLDTDNWLRNRHLRSQKYFYTKAHPRLSFKSKSIIPTTNGFLLRGQLTIKGISQNVIWRFVTQEDNLTGTTYINTHDYNIKVYDEQSRNDVSVKIVLPYTR